MAIIKGFKGYDKDLKCRGHQFEVGKTYEVEGDAKLCENGFHFCEYPLDVFGYYPPANSRYTLVTGEDVSDERESSDTKVCAKKLTVGAEIDILGLVKASVEYIKERVDKSTEKKENGYRSVASNTGDQSVATNTGDRSVASNTGDRSVASNTGYRSMASNTGDRSVASNTGDRSMASNTGDCSVASNTGYWSVASNTGYQSVASNTGDRSVASNTGYRSMASNTGDCSVASNTGYQSVASNTGYQSVASNTGYQSVASVSGKESVAIATGIEAVAKGALGCWLVLGEQEKDGDGAWHFVDVKTFKVDGEIIKADTYYKLVNGEAIETELNA